MAQKIEVKHVSDLDETIPADETVRFGLDGTDYEIDLSTAEGQEMRGRLERFVRHARKTGRTPAARKQRASRDDLPQIREYARARGYSIAERGKVPGRIVAEYDLLNAYQSA